jgi:predicted metalloprotease
MSRNILSKSLAISNTYDKTYVLAVQVPLKEDGENAPLITDSRSRIESSGSGGGVVVVDVEVEVVVVVLIGVVGSIVVDTIGSAEPPSLPDNTTTRVTTTAIATTIAIPPIVYVNVFFFLLATRTWKF